MMSKREKIYLWSGTAPYSDESPEQNQPSMTHFEVDGARGAVIVCPGGGYCMKADHEGNPIAEMLNEVGIAAFVLDYRVHPCNMNAPLSDALRAIKIARSIGYEKVAILGFSAGGHLTCSAATLYDTGNKDSSDPIEHFSSRPDAFIPCYPVVSFNSYQHLGSAISLLGNSVHDGNIRRKFSAELNVNSQTPPAFIWHTADDDGVPVENSLMLANALSRHSVPFELHIFPHGRHGLGLAKDNPVVGKWAEMCQKWLLDLGFGK